MYLEWHPTAENILLSAGYDHLIIVWNIAKGQCVNVIDCHEDTIYSMSFNRCAEQFNAARKAEENMACGLCCVDFDVPSWRL